MSDLLNKTIYHNTIENWLISFAIIILASMLARLTYLFIGKGLKQITTRTKTILDDLILNKMEKPAIMLIILAGFRFAMERLHFTDGLDTLVQKTFIILITLNVTWFLIRLIEAFIEAYLIPYSKRDDNTMDNQMILLIERIMRVVIWTIGIISGLNNAGFDVGAMLTGLGIGGLALALAAQDTVKNIFGGVMIFMDRPFRLGDRIKISEIDGFVEYIGVRSTRVRTLQGRLITIPNAHFSDRAIENITIEPARRVNTTLGLTYDTPPEKIGLAIQLLRKISDDNKHLIENERTMIFFEKFNAYSLDVNFYYFIRKESSIFETQTELNKQILKAFNENGLEFAFPTQTLHANISQNNDSEELAPAEVKS